MNGEPDPPDPTRRARGGLLDDLDRRGLVHDATDRAALAARLAEGPLTVYCGFDPTADSLHIGSLVPLLLLRRFQDAGHRVVALAGGATGMIGDPSGRSQERNLLDDEALAANLAGIRAQIARFLVFDGADAARLVDNRTWTEPVGVLEFLREVGKHLTVNAMLARESVKARLSSEQGISYTEFSYMLLQAFDYWHLHRELGCELQVGGSDQWGNITAGIELIRKKDGVRVHGLTVPLVTRADGQKFGKTAAGAVWLSAERTTPYDFYQYWMQVDDRDVERFLLQLTLLDVDEALAVSAEHAADPSARVGQRRLADEITTLVHGAAAAAEAAAASTGFAGAGDQLGPDELAALEGQLPTARRTGADLDAGLDVVDLLVETGLAASKGEARRKIAEGGVRVNDERLAEPRPVGRADLRHDRWVVLRLGRKRRSLVVVGERDQV